MSSAEPSAQEGGQSPFPHKPCSACGLDKRLDDFDLRTDSPDGRRGVCRTCSNAYRRKRYEARWGRRPPEDPVAAVQEAEEGLIFDLASFGTTEERICAQAMLRCGTLQAAADMLEMSPERLRQTLGELHRRAALRGYAPGHGDTTVTSPPGYHIRGVSTQIDGDGNVISQWVKTQKDNDNPLAAIIDAVADIAAPFRGKSEIAPVPSDSNDDLLAVYTMGDPHFGMHSWFEETGHNFDLDIAEANLCAAVDRLVDLAPPAKRALLIELGDFFHADNAAATTTRGTKVDVDTRWAKVLRIGIRAMRRCIDRMLLKHEVVDVIIEIGNHDSHAAIMLALCLSQYYENNPRVHIDTSPEKYHWYRFGKCLIGVTHGDTAKWKDLPSIMAVDRAQDWGETVHRRWYCGHVHHETVKEFPGVVVETMRSLAPADAWHAGQGYRSQQDMRMDVWHRERGLENRQVVGIRQLFDTRVEREIRSA